MAKGTPTAGYSSKAEACAALRKQGKTTTEIAALTGVAAYSVATLESHHRNRLKGRRVDMPVFLVRQLSAAAEARGLKPTQLALKILDEVARGQLVDAILDDGGAA